ncbi:SDR family NAD(P)-dependent oxidoreductase, partial [Kineococcus glutinatus]|uniref:SDR family NAD(P)-dependent oxidoreductase n=1 Tax=Kineococcus glutinatus TaxID=1070872 RepID=UPI0031E8C0F9
GRPALAGRVVLVTGVTSGIGRASAAALLAAGALVVGCARDGERLAEVAARLPGLRVRGCDVTDAGQRRDLVEHVLAEHGRVDALVANAGVGWEGLVAQMGAEDVERLYATNVVGVVDLTRLLLPQMLARGDGDVLVVSSAAAFVALPPLTVYSSTKWAVQGFADGLRREVRGRGVRVHTVNPGFVRTEWLSRSLGHRPSEREPGLRPSPGVAPERVAAAVLSCLAAGRSRTVSVPRAMGLARVLTVQPLRAGLDAVWSRAAPSLARGARRVARERTPG